MLGLTKQTASAIVRGQRHTRLGGPITIIPKRSRFVGVAASYGKWGARLQIKGIVHHLGTFVREIDAARAYNNFIIAHSLNRPLNVIEELFLRRKL